MNPLHLYFLTKLLTGLRFFVPIWIIWGSKFLSVEHQGWLETGVVTISILAELPTGAFADLFGRKTSLALGWFLSGLSFIGVGFATNSIQYICWWLFGAISSAFVSGSESAWLYDYLKERYQEKSFAKISAKGALWFRAGIILATFTGGYLFKTHSWLPYLLMGILYIISAICWLLLPEPKIDSQTFSFSTYLNQIKLGVQSAFKTPATTALTWYYMIVGAIIQVCFWFFNYAYAKDLGFGGDKQSLLFGISGIIKAIFVFVLAKYLFKIGKRNIYWGFVIIPALFLLPSAFSSTWLSIFIILVIEGIGAARITVLDHFANEEFDSRVRATALSFLNMGVSLIYAFLLIIGGPISNQNHTNLLYTYLGIGLLFVGLPLAYRINKSNSVKLNS